MTHSRKWWSRFHFGLNDYPGQRKKDDALCVDSEQPAGPKQGYVTMIYDAIQRMELQRRIFSPLPRCTVAFCPGPIIIMNEKTHIDTKRAQSTSCGEKSMKHFISWCCL